MKNYLVFNDNIFEHLNNKKDIKKGTPISTTGISCYYQRTVDILSENKRFLF